MRVESLALLIFTDLCFPDGDATMPGCRFEFAQCNRCSILVHTLPSVRSSVRTSLGCAIFLIILFIVFLIIIIP